MCVCVCVCVQYVCICVRNWSSQEISYTHWQSCEQCRCGAWFHPGPHWHCASFASAAVRPEWTSSLPGTKGKNDWHPCFTDYLPMKTLRQHIFLDSSSFTHTCTHTHTHTHAFTYMHTCIHTYMHTCIHTYMHTCIHTHMHTCIHTHAFTHIHTHTHTATHTHTYTHIPPLTHIHTHTHTATHTHAHTHIPPLTHMHTHTHSQRIWKQLWLRICQAGSRETQVRDDLTLALQGDWKPSLGSQSDQQAKHNAKEVRWNHADHTYIGQNPISGANKISWPLGFKTHRCIHSQPVEKTRNGPVTNVYL